MLTEEQEATLRRDALLEDARYRTPRGQWFDADIEQIWALLDAARAEADRLRQAERHAQNGMALWHNEAITLRSRAAGIPPAPEGEKGEG